VVGGAWSEDYTAPYMSVSTVAHSSATIIGIAINNPA